MFKTEGRNSLRFFYVRCPAQSRPVAIMFVKPLLFQFLEAEHLRPLEFGHGSLAFSLRCNLRAVYDNWPGLLPARDRASAQGTALQNSPGFPSNTLLKRASAAMCGFCFFFRFSFRAFIMVSVDSSRPQKSFEHPDSPAAAPEV